MHLTVFCASVLHAYSPQHTACAFIPKELPVTPTHRLNNAKDNVTWELIKTLH